LTMQSLTPWRHLHDPIKRKVADLQGLSAEVTANPPFSNLPALAASVEERFNVQPALIEDEIRDEWLSILGEELSRARWDDEEETRRVRSLASRLAKTTRRTSSKLEILPYIDGTPAGVPRK